MTFPALDEAGGGPVLATWTQFIDPAFIDLLGAAGYACTIIDGEHGAFGIETAAALVRACDAARIVPLVRVPRGDRTWISKVLDAGAAGIVSPQCESAEEARRLVAATRFAPDGTRGACPIVRMAAHSLRPWADAAHAQQNVGVIALIETPTGVEQSEAIAAVDGLGGIMVGPFDLSVAIGLPGQLGHPSVRSPLERVVAAARSRGMPAWVPVFAAEPAALQEEVARWSALGVRHFVIGADKIIAGHALANYRRAARQAADAAIPRG